ncbi:MAG: hypothetical protein AABX52_01605 [Nanoarchaeota archaeon]
MLDKKEFQSIRKDLEEFEANREHLIRASRDIITHSKEILYALQRGDIDKAKSVIPLITKEVKALPDVSYDTGMGSVAVQEYVEAMMLFHVLMYGKVPTRKELGVVTQEYLLGLCDLSGEVLRRAVKAVIEKDYVLFQKLKDLVNEIWGEVLFLELRNGELRKKSDQIKYAVKRLEDVEYDLAVKGIRSHNKEK